MLERPHGFFERDILREELVHVYQGAGAGVIGALRGVPKLSDSALERRGTNST